MHSISEKQMRIISTVPSITELLSDLDLEDKVVGITKFCIHPRTWYKTKSRIGGTKNLNISKIKELQPDLVIANKEENVREQIESIQTFSRVHITDVQTLEDNVHLIRSIGKITGTQNQALKLESDFYRCLQSLNAENKKTVLYLIWNEPMMTIGHDTYIHDVLKQCGFLNVSAHKRRYPTISLEEIRQLKPDLILLSSEPFPFSHKHTIAFEQSFPNSKVKLVDGEAFSWYGSRFIKKIKYLQQLTF